MSEDLVNSSVFGPCQEGFMRSSFVLAMRFKTRELQVKGRKFSICLAVAFLPPPGDIL